MKQITKPKYFQLVGLLALASTYNAKLKDIEKAAMEITGDEENGHTSDAIYCDYSADTLCEKLSVEVLDVEF